MNRSRLLAAGLIIALAPIANLAYAAETPRGSPQMVGEQQVPTNKDEMEAVEVARDALARSLDVPAGTLPVLGIEKGSWPNSGLGCASLDTATINIGRKGYDVTLATTDGVRHVHVAGRTSRICEPPVKFDSNAAREISNNVSPTYDLNAEIERSREDLARRLKVPVKSVRLVSFVATTWPDNTMDCAVAAEQARKKSTKGYRIQLRKGDRLYVYHTDLSRTRACPAIDTATVSASSQNYDLPAPTKSSAPRKSSAKKKVVAEASNSPSYLGIVQRYPSP